MMPDLSPATPPLVRRRWLRLSIGLLMLLIATVAVGLAFWDQAHRVRVVFGNRSGKVIRVVTVRHEGRMVEFGPIPPRSSAERRIRSALVEPIRLSFDVVDGPGQADRHIVPPGITASGPGEVVEVKFDGP